MKILKFTLVSLLMMVGIQLMAQPGNFDPEERVKRQTERLAEELELTPDQITQVENVNRAQMDKMKAAREEAQGDREMMREMRQGAVAEREARYKEIFTPEQWTKFEQIKAENKDKRQGPGKKPKKGKKKKKKKNEDSDSDS